MKTSKTSGKIDSAAVVNLKEEVDLLQTLIESAVCKQPCPKSQLIMLLTLETHIQYKIEEMASGLDCLDNLRKVAKETFAKVAAEQ